MAPRPPGPDTSATPTRADVAALKARARARDQAHADAYAAGQADAAAGHPQGHSRPLESEHDEAANGGSLVAAYDSGYTERAGGPLTRAPGAPGGGSRGTPGSPPAPASSRRAPGASLLSGRPQSSVDSAAGLVLGMVAYALAINFLRGGMPAVRGWFAAKMLNHPYQGPLNAKTYTTPAQPAQPAPNTPVGPPVGVPSVIAPGP